MKGLEKRRIPRMNTAVTFIDFGVLEIGRNWGLGKDDEVQRPEEQDAKEVLETVLDIGINLIDTASAYHRVKKELASLFLTDAVNMFLLQSVENTVRSQEHIVIFHIRL